MGMTAQQRAERWQRGMNNATTNMKQGVEQLQVNPMELAAAAQDRWAAGVQRSRENGTFAAGCQSVSAQTWKNRYITKGLPRIAEGVAQAKPVMEAFAAQHQPVCDAAKEAARQERAQGIDGRTRMNNNLSRMEGFRFQRPRV